MGIVYMQDAGRTSQTQLLQRLDTARLQQLSHDPVRLFQALLQQDHTAPLLAERHGGGAARDACADDDDVGFVVLAPTQLTVVNCDNGVERALVRRHWSCPEGSGRGGALESGRGRGGGGHCGRHVCGRWVEGEGGSE